MPVKLFRRTKNITISHFDICSESLKIGIKNPNLYRCENRLPSCPNTELAVHRS